MSRKCRWATFKDTRNPSFMEISVKTGTSLLDDQYFRQKANKRSEYLARRKPPNLKDSLFPGLRTHPYKQQKPSVPLEAGPTAIPTPNPGGCLFSKPSTYNKLLPCRPSGERTRFTAHEQTSSLHTKHHRWYPYAIPTRQSTG